MDIGIPTTNFVGELQAKCQSAHISLPDYSVELIGNGFKVSCMLKGLICYGTGTSKKFAKQIAAKSMLDKIENGNLILDDSQRTPNKSSISKIMEFCTKNKKDTPLFSELPKEGELFSYSCSLEDFTAVGKGYSKKEAKEKAANKVADHFDVHKYFYNLEKEKERMLANISPLQELSVLCLKKHLGAPRYEEVEVTENKIKKYKMICHVGDLKEESVFTHSKKSAKYEVATLLLQSLKRNTPFPSPVDTGDEEPKAVIETDSSKKEETKPAIETDTSKKEETKPAIETDTSKKEETKPVIKRKLSSDSDEPFLEPLKIHKH